MLINKLRHGPGGDWNNDHDDVRNLVGLVSRDWKNLLTWQVVDPERRHASRTCSRRRSSSSTATRPPSSRAEGKKNLRDYVEQGGFIFAEACCGRAEFDQGFRALMKEIFPEPEYELHPLAEDHAVWRSPSTCSSPTSTRSGGSSTAAGPS